MKFLLPALVFSNLVFASVADLQPRDAKSILGAISTISSDIDTLTASVKAFQGDINDALEISMESDQLSQDIQAATDTTNDSAKLKNAGSQQISKAILNLEPKIFKLLKLLVKKKPQFDSVLNGAGSMIVLQTLQDQRGYTKDFGLAIQSKLSKQYAALAPAERKKIDNAFKKAIAAYQDDGSS